jgi:hypothetical protein
MIPLRVIQLSYYKYFLMKYHVFNRSRTPDDAVVVRYLAASLHNPLLNLPTAYVDPTIGNVGLLEPTRPTAHLPNEPVRVYPIRKDYLDDQITCFPLTAVSHRLGEVFALRPTPDR